MIGFGAPTYAADISPSPTVTPSHTSSTTDPDLMEELHRDELLESVESRDLMGYGLIPEFVGRFPMVVNLSSLDRDSLVKILTEPQDALVPQYTHLFKIDQVGIYWDEG